MKNSHNRKLHNIPGLVFAIPIIAIFLLTFSVNVNAATSNTYFPIYQNENNLVPDTVYNYILNNYGQYFFIRYVGNDGTYTSYYYVSFSASYNKPVATLSNNGYQFSVVDNGHVVNNGRIRVVNSTGQITRDSNNGGFNSAFTNLNSSSYSSSASYRSNFDLYTSGGDGVLLIYVPVTVPDLGHSQTYMNNIPTFGYPIGMHPTSAPTVPTYTQPTLTTPPSIDTTDIKTVAQSIFNLLAWVLQSILSYLGSIIQTLIDWFTFISNLAIWIADFIKQCFVALMDFLYNNFTHLFQPIFDFYTKIFKAIFNLDDQESIFDIVKDFKTDVTNWINNYWSNSFLADFWTNLTNTYSYFQTLFVKVLLFFDKLILLGSVNSEFSISNLLNALFVPDAATVTAHLMAHDDFYFLSTSHAIVEKGNYIVTTITSITPAKTFYVPATTWHEQTIGGFYLDFSWYDDYKTYGDLIISTFLSLTFVYWVLINMSNFIRGQSSVGSDVSRLEK